MILKELYIVTSPTMQLMVYLLVILHAAITNYHKFRGLKQHKFIILGFCRSEVSQGSHWA